MSERRVTGSKLERIMACPTSITLPHIESTSSYAERGTVLHLYLELAGVHGREIALEQIAQSHPEWLEPCSMLDLSALPVGAQWAQEVSLAYSPARDTARELGRRLTREDRAAVYATCADDEIPLTVDVVGLASDHIYAGDFKTGWSPVTAAQRNWQIRIAALAGARAYGKMAARGEIIRVREDRSPYQSRAWFDGFDLAGFADELGGLEARIAHAVRETASGTPVPHEGGWCEYCPAQLSCPAKTALVRRLAAGTEAEELESLLPLTPESAAIAFHRLGAARKMLSRIESAIYALAKLRPIPLGDGTVLEERESEGNEQLDGPVVHRVLTELYGVHVANAAVSYEATKRGIADALRAPAKNLEQPLAKLNREVLAEIRKQGGATKPVKRRIAVFEVES